VCDVAFFFPANVFVYFPRPFAFLYPSPEQLSSVGLLRLPYTPRCCLPIVFCVQGNPSRCLRVDERSRCLVLGKGSLSVRTFQCCGSGVCCFSLCPCRIARFSPAFFLDSAANSGHTNGHPHPKRAQSSSTFLARRLFRPVARRHVDVMRAVQQTADTTVAIARLLSTVFHPWSWRLGFHPFALLRGVSA